MDAQMKRGFLDACVLATLLRGESYGYQIIKDAPLSLGLSESTLYPLLKRLETRGLINVRKAEHNGRLRKYYSLTEEGRAAVRDFLDDQTEVLNLYRFVQQAALTSGTASRGTEPADTAGPPPPPPAASTPTAPAPAPDLDARPTNRADAATNAPSTSPTQKDRP